MFNPIHDAILDAQLAEDILSLVSQKGWEGKDLPKSGLFDGLTANPRGIRPAYRAPESGRNWRLSGFCKARILSQLDQLGLEQYNDGTRTTRIRKIA